MNLLEVATVCNINKVYLIFEPFSIGLNLNE